MIHYDERLGLSDLPDVVMKAIRDLTPHVSEFDSVAVQGVSGCIIGSPVAIALGKPLVIVRKDSDMLSPHCRHVSVVENSGNAGRRVLFLDDYVGEGKTLRDVHDKLSYYTFGRIIARYETLYGEYTAGARTLAARV
jgi:adenine/guanine phosphoribosyltransferase-like PRPP-binding protein